MTGTALFVIEELSRYLSMATSEFCQNAPRGRAQVACSGARNTTQYSAGQVERVRRNKQFMNPSPIAGTNKMQ